MLFILVSNAFHHRKSSQLSTNTQQRLFRSSKTPQQGTIDQYSTHRVSAFAKLISVLIAVAILVIPIFVLLWIPETRAWISATVLISVFVFSALMSLLTEARVQEVLVGTAA